MMIALQVALAAAVVPGCRRDGGGLAHGERFPAGGQVRAVDRFAQVQSAAAARADATLNADHFDGRGGLNSLGRQKLDLMLRDDNAADPLVVYLNLPSARAAAGGSFTGSTADHRQSVHVYLLDRGVPDDQIELRSGPNLGYSHPADEGLRGLRRLEGDTGAPGADAVPGLPGAAGKADAGSRAAGG